MNEWEWRLLEERMPLESANAGGIELRPGDHVRLKPRAGGDVFDLALAGRAATVEVIEPDLNELNEPAAQAMMVEAHTMNPMRALGLAKSMNGELKRVLLVGCEPATFGPEEGQMGLSETVEAAVQGAVEMVESLIAEIQSG